MNKRTPLLVFVIIISGAMHTLYSQCTDLFFSEYIEGSGANRGIEIYNPTGDTIDLAGYEIHRTDNGGTTANFVLPLSGMVAPNDVYVITTPTSDSVMLLAKDTTSLVAGFTGNDALLLLHPATSDTLDIIGEVGALPVGGAWLTAFGSTKNFTIVRADYVHDGTTNWIEAAQTWWAYPIDTFTFLGNHSMQPCLVGTDTLPCETQVFISEYAEGLANNRALELYNPLDTAVDLSNYEIHRTNNGSPNAVDIFVCDGMLAPGGTYVVGNAAADSLLQTVFDTTSTITLYTGNDALLLIYTPGNDTLDIIGEVGVNPGTLGWPTFNGGSTSNRTLVRRPDVQEGTTDWSISQNQWISFAANTFVYLTDHMFFGCINIVDTPTVSIQDTLIITNEGGGSIDFDVKVTGLTSMSLSVDVALSGGSATDGVDFNWADTTLTFNPGSPNTQSLSVEILEDLMIEPTEDIQISLSNPTGDLQIENGSLTIEIEDNDYPLYAIGLLTDDADMNGLGDSLGINCQVQGIVHGIDFQGGNLIQFTLIDATGGIAVFSFNDYGYVVQEGDELLVQGEITEFRGLTQIEPDTILVISTGNGLNTPVEVSQLDETTESEMVKISCLALVDTANWPTDPGSVNMPMINNVDTFTVRIDSDTDIDETPVPASKWLSIAGIGGQFTNNVPPLDGYQILPRYMADIKERTDPSSFYTDGALDGMESGPGVSAGFLLLSGNPDSTQIDLSLISGMGTATEGLDFAFTDTSFYQHSCSDDTFSLPIAFIDDGVLEGDEDFYVALSATNNGMVVGMDTLKVTIIDETTDAIEDLIDTDRIQLYPNPGKDHISLKADLPLQSISMVDVKGRVILTESLTGSEWEGFLPDLPAGLYLIRVQTVEGTWTGRWLKE